MSQTSTQNTPVSGSTPFGIAEVLNDIDIDFEGQPLQDLLQNVVESCSKADLTNKQRQVLEAHKIEPIFQVQDFTKYSENEVLLSYAKVFDNLFFGGAITQISDIRFINNAKQSGKPANPYLTTAGETSLVKRLNEHGRFFRGSVICIYKATGMPGPSALLQYLETLLHEMCHAYLGTQGLRSELLADNIELCGPRGHGYIFLDLLHAVLLATSNPDMLKIPVCTADVPLLLAHEVNHYGLSIPKPERWGLKKSNIRRVWIEAGQPKYRFAIVVSPLCTSRVFLDIALSRLAREGKVIWRSHEMENDFQDPIEPEVSVLTKSLGSMNFKSNAAENSGDESRGQRSIIENIEEQQYEKWCQKLALAINKNLTKQGEYVYTQD